MESLYNDLRRNDLRTMAEQFKQFKASFQGDPKREVEKLMQSGRLSQRDLDSLQAMATELQKFLS